MKLTEIPIELRAEILSKLSTAPLASSDAPKFCTLETSTWSFDSFPDDMLHSAQASTKLSEAVIRAFGSHVKILNFHRSRRMSEWIPILRKHIKAVSLSGLPALHDMLSLDDIAVLSNSRHKDIVATLKALDNNEVALEALNLEGLTASDGSEAVEVAEHVSKAIQASSSSLKEIALHINFASVMAIQQVTLPNLEVAQISSDDYDGEGFLELLNVPSPAKTFGAILQGINGHADRRLNISTVRELRLYNIHKAPILRRGRCPGLFLAIQKLIIMCGNNSKNSEIASFIANFWNLKTLHWFTGFICPGDMDTIFGGCTHLKKMNISTGQRRILFGGIDLAQNTSRLKDLFISFRGKHRNLELSSYLSCEQIKILGEYSPNLRILEMEIDGDNVGALSLLLGTHCRNIRELRLLYSRDAIDCLGQDGWSALAQGICSASEKLCVLSFVGDRTGPMIERAPNEMVEAIIKILEFLGDRACCIVFRVPINTHNPFIVLDALVQTLNEAKTHCRFIETLCLDFIQDYSLGGYRIENNSDEDRLMEFIMIVATLQTDFFPRESPNKVDLGDVDALWEIQDEMEEEQGDVDQDLNDGPGEQAGGDAVAGVD